MRRDWNKKIKQKRKTNIKVRGWCEEKSGTAGENWSECTVVKRLFMEGSIG